MGIRDGRVVGCSGYPFGLMCMVLVVVNADKQMCVCRLLAVH